MHQHRPSAPGKPTASRPTREFPVRHGGPGELDLPTFLIVIAEGMRKLIAEGEITHLPRRILLEIDLDERHCGVLEIPSSGNDRRRGTDPYFASARRAGPSCDTHRLPGATPRTTAA
jgi:hypothetical protein